MADRFTHDESKPHSAYTYRYAFPLFMPSSLTKSQLVALVKRLCAASAAYHNGTKPIMTDAEFDEAMDTLRDADPDNPFLFRVGAPVKAEDATLLPFPLPSLSKIKPDDGSLDKWFQRNPATTYTATTKLDGISALWIPKTQSLFTRGDGMEGRDISSIVPFLCPFGSGSLPLPLPLDMDATAIRGELVMYTDSKWVPPGMLARNVVAGALNRKLHSSAPTDADRLFFREIRFVAYEIVLPVNMRPTCALQLLRNANYEVVAEVDVGVNRSPEHLSAVFSRMEAESPYQADGIVVAPDVARPASWVPTLKQLVDGKTVVMNPTDRVAWKTRVMARTADITVREVVWSVTKDDNLIPVVNFDTVLLSGANLSNATGLHGRWIFENRVGPGAHIRIQRSGDTIPRILEVLAAAPGGPQMPLTAWVWSADEETSIHVKPVTGTLVAERAQIRLVHALGELGAEHVGPGVVERLYAAGFRTIRTIYAATASELAATPGFKEAGAQRVWVGLRAGQKGWTQLTFLVASCTMPRSVGHRKLQPLLEIEPNVADWPVTLRAVVVPGLGPSTLAAILAAVPAYLEWRRMAGLELGAPTVHKTQVQQSQSQSQSQYVVVFTDVRDKAFEAVLEAAGHAIVDTVTRKTTHVVYPNGPRPTTMKISKAIALGHSVRIIPISEMKAICS